MTFEDGAALIQDWYGGTLEEISDMPQGEQPEEIDEFMDRIDTLADRGAISKETQKACKEALQNEKNKIVDANIRGVAYKVGKNALGVSSFAIPVVGPAVFGLGAMHNIGKGIVDYVKGE